MPEITPETLGQLIERHAGPLELYASQWTAAPGDVVQEAFLRLFQQRPAPANPVAWLYRTVRHRSLNDARGRRRRDRHERRAAELRPALVAPPDSMLDADEVRLQIKAEWRKDADAAEKTEKIRTAREATIQQLSLIDAKIERMNAMRTELSERLTRYDSWLREHAAEPVGADS